MRAAMPASPSFPYTRRGSNAFFDPTPPSIFSTPS